MGEWDEDEGEHWAANADRYTTMLAAFGDLVTEAAGFAPGEAVLDVGCGNGDLSRLAGRAVGPTGRVQGVDLSPQMLAVARRRAEDEGLAQIRLTRADAASFVPDPADFDVLVSRFGVMFFTDPPAAFHHLRSLLRPGGRMAFVCWQGLLANEWMMVPGAALAEVLPLPAGGGGSGPGPFALADGDRLGMLLGVAGFRGVSVHSVEAPLWLGDDAADAVAFLRTTGLGRAMFADADPETAAEAVRRVEGALDAYATDSGVILGGAAWLATARV